MGCHMRYMHSVAGSLMVANRLRTRSNEVNMTVTQAKTWTQDVSNLFWGLTRKIDGICYDLREVGAAISVRHHIPVNSVFVSTCDFA